MTLINKAQLIRHQYLGEININASACFEQAQQKHFSLPRKKNFLSEKEELVSESWEENYFFIFTFKLFFMTPLCRPSCKQQAFNHPGSTNT